MRKMAFTLIELLVVIAIISLLVAMLLPSLNLAKRLAKVSVELSNLRSVGSAIHMYGAENSGLLPGGNSGRQRDHKLVRNRLYENNYLDGATDYGTATNPNFSSTIWGCPLTDNWGLKDVHRHGLTWFWNIGAGNSFSDDGAIPQIYTAGSYTWNVADDDPVYLDGKGFYRNKSGDVFSNPYQGPLSTIVVICDAGYIPRTYVPGAQIGTSPGHTHNSLFTPSDVAPEETTSWMLDGHARIRSTGEMRFYTFSQRAWY